MISSAQEMYNELSANYDRLYQSSRHKAEELRVYKYFCPPTEDLNVLDIGCGTGSAISGLGIPAKNYIGLDVSERMICEAHRKFPSHRFVTDWQDLGNYRADLVIMLFGSPSYLPPRQITYCLSNHLMPGGVAVIMFYSEHYRPPYHRNFVAPLTTEDVRLDVLNSFCCDRFLFSPIFPKCFDDVPFKAWNAILKNLAPARPLALRYRYEIIRIRPHPTNARPRRRPCL